MQGVASIGQCACYVLPLRVQPGNIDIKPCALPHSTTLRCLPATCCLPTSHLLWPLPLPPPLGAPALAPRADNASIRQSVVGVTAPAHAPARAPARAPPARHPSTSAAGRGRGSRPGAPAPLACRGTALARAGHGRTAGGAAAPLPRADAAAPCAAAARRPTAGASARAHRLAGRRCRRWRVTGACLPFLPPLPTHMGTLIHQPSRLCPQVSLRCGSASPLPPCSPAGPHTPPCLLPCSRGGYLDRRPGYDRRPDYDRRDRWVGQPRGVCKAARAEATLSTLPRGKRPVLMPSMPRPPLLRPAGMAARVTAGPMTGGRAGTSAAGRAAAGAAAAGVAIRASARAATSDGSRPSSRSRR